jgi:hypothetical protein
MTKQDVLDQCNIVGNVVFLPDTQLDRKLYMEVQKALKGIGGKWNRGSKGFLFTEDPSELMGRVKKGEKVNLKKEFQEFFTPKVVAIYATRKGVAMSTKPLFNVLEPSAGDGALVEEILLQCDDVDITAVELQERNCIKLADRFEGRGIEIINADFLDFAIEAEGLKFDLIIANPPFTKNQDIKHLHAMLGLIRPGGVVSCIMSTGWLRNSTKVCKEFRKFLGLTEPVDGPDTWIRNLSINGGGTVTTIPMDFVTGIDTVQIETLDRGSFKEAGTLVPTAIVTIKTLG